MNNFAVSLVRTVVPVIVGSLIGLLVTLGIDLPADAGESLTIGIQALAIALYYLGARWLEQRWPIFGYLLGTRAEPVYVTPGHDTGWSETPAKVQETDTWARDARDRAITGGSLRVLPEADLQNAIIDALNSPTLDHLTIDPTTGEPYVDLIDLAAGLTRELQADVSSVAPSSVDPEV